MELSTNILEDVFRITRQFAAGRATLSQARDTLVRDHDFNPNSASITIRSLSHLLKGERYRRALTIGATDYFLGRILEDDGPEALRTALRGLSLHIDYRERDNGVNVIGLRSVLSKYSK
jgi:hypothetical protein